MFALRSGTGDGGGMRAIGLHMLPVRARKPLRLLARIFAGDVVPPRFGATMATVALLGATGAYGAWLGGQWPTIVQAVTSRSGFAIDSVHVTGNRETSEIDVLGVLGLNGWTSQIGFSAEAARKRVETLPWVASASVRKIYPSTVEISVREKTPFAIWQHGGQLSLIQEDGTPIAPFGGSHYATLPLIVGDGAADLGARIVAKVEQFPDLAGRVKGYIRVGERRWDLKFENGVTVRLPEEDEDAAIADLARMDIDHGLLSRDIVAVDMRLDDRLVVQLTPEAAEARAIALKERAKQDRRSGRNI